MVNDRAESAHVASALADRGVAAASIEYRTADEAPFPGALQDVKAAVRWMRANANLYGISPVAIGTLGGSSGAHMALLAGISDDRDLEGSGGNNNVSSRVQAVACFFPPTDFLNYGKPGENAIGRGVLKDFPAPFAFTELQKKGYAGLYVPITDEAKILEIGKQISPINHVSEDDAPSLIIHGDKDYLVPIQQAEIIIDKLKAAKVPAELVVKPGAGHGSDFGDHMKEMGECADWFDEYLLGVKAKG